ncbi:zinc ribbon domain-containing protein [Paenibacillus aestuarii]|uniref:Zinc-ribbon domain-containing protein n=1 Tax=Paenibacillus aestuarii TaxID=516965 RepID=A0ABW0KGF2_9BACL|nr:zinc ribbon domain-containing protein [Paenibacillus aestuarii]
MTFFGKMRESAAKAAEKAKETVEITRLSAQISLKKKEIERLQQHIGESVYQAYVAGDFASSEASVVALCEQIGEKLQEISSIEHKVKEIKNEKVCVCGAELSADTKFCPSCGHKFEPPIPVEASQPEAAAAGVEATAVEEKAAAHCQQCDAELEAEARFCGACGAPVA